MKSARPILIVLSAAVFVAGGSAARADGPDDEKKVVERLLNDLLASQATTRINAARDLAGHKEARVVEALNAALRIERLPPVRFQMLQSLVLLGDRASRPLLRTYCTTSFWNINLEAARTLRDVGDTSYLSHMVDLGLASPDRGVRDAVLQGLRFLSAPEASSTVRRAMKTGAGRASAAHLLAFLEGPEAEPALIDALADRTAAPGAARGLAVIARPKLPDALQKRLFLPESAAGAAQALGLIGGPAACRILFDALDDRTHPKAGTQAALAIMRQSFGFGVPRVEHRWTLDRWRTWWRKNRAGVGGFENVTIPAGLVPVRGVGHRVSWGDFDNDGYDDLLVSGRHLFRNTGRGGFTDVTGPSGIGRDDVVAGVWADYNNDGRLDCYVVSRDPKKRDALWRNQGDGTFIDVTDDAGRITDEFVSESAAWADYDRDGHVDLFVINSRSLTDKPTDPGIQNRLYRNKGDGTFIDVSAVSRLGRSDPRSSRGVAWGDYDNDGDPDCYVANHFYQANRLWRNNGDGTFSDVAAELRAGGRAHAVKEAGADHYGRSLGCAWADYDNDGWLDLFCANLAPPDRLLYCDQSMLLKNRVGERGARGASAGFRDVRGGVGITYEETHAGCAWGDYDNDGDQDLILTSTTWGRRSYLYRNNGDGTFTDVTWATGTRVLNGYGCAWADFDCDGRLDVAVAGNYGVRLFRNVTVSANQWLQVKLLGTKSNRAAIGARVTVKTAAATQIREVGGGRGTGCQDSLVQHFGLGAMPGPVTVTVRWPGGETQRLTEVKTNRRITVTEPR